MPPVLLFALTLCGILGALLYNPLLQRGTTLGLFRREIFPMHGTQLKIIPNTLQCEDLHHHLPSNLLFTACQTGDPQNRRKWFPPLAHFDESGLTKGTIVVVDPKTFESTHLILRGFKGPFVTHGIDIFSSPADPAHLTIFAINHLRYETIDPDFAPNAPKAQSQIEVFRHTIGSSTADYIRSIWHPLIRTPNDIYATSATSFYVTNDHYYREGRLRALEDYGTRALAGWSDTVHVSFSDIPTRDSMEGVTATKALTGLHNNNGLGHGSTADPGLVAIGDATGGELTLARRNLAPRPREPNDLKLAVLSHIQIDSTIDNPKYYEDPYAIPSNNASGFVIAGVGKAYDAVAAIETGRPLPSLVWHVTPGQEEGSWEKKIIFQDDGNTISAAATAVLVAVDPADTEGKKQAWLFVTGFLSDAMVASLVDL